MACTKSLFKGHTTFQGFSPYTKIRTGAPVPLIFRSLIGDASHLWAATLHLKILNLTTMGQYVLVNHSHRTIESRCQMLISIDFRETPRASHVADLQSRFPAAKSILLALTARVASEKPKSGFYFFVDSTGLSVCDSVLFEKPEDISNLN